MTALAASRDRREPARAEVEAANALVVEVAEVQPAVRTDDEAVWIVDLRIGVPGDTGADDDRDVGRHGKRGDGECGGDAGATCEHRSAIINASRDVTRVNEKKAAPLPERRFELSVGWRLGGRGHHRFDAVGIERLDDEELFGHGP